VINKGNKAGFVLRTSMLVVRLDDATFAKTFPGATIASRPPQFNPTPESVPLDWSPVGIPPGGSWSQFVMYAQPLSPANLSALHTATTKMLSELPSRVPTGQSVSDSTFADIERVVNATFDGFGPGRYGMLTRVWDSDSGRPIMDHCDVVELPTSTYAESFNYEWDNYRKGIGIIYPYPYNGPLPDWQVTAHDCDTATRANLEKQFSAD
jgi:hypothetical protein